MIYNNYNIVQNIYERRATGGRIERFSFSRMLNRDRDCYEKSVHLFNHSSKIWERKSDEEKIDSLSKSGQTIMDVL